MNAGASRARYIQPESPPCHGFQYDTLGTGTRATVIHPPTAWSASGSAIAKPASFTASCTMFTHAEVSSPPAVKYTITTPPPTRQPAYFGRPVTTLRIVEIAMSWTAGTASDPIQSRSDVIARTLRP